MFEIELVISIKIDLALNNLQRLIFLTIETNKRLVSVVINPVSTKQGN